MNYPPDAQPLSFATNETTASITVAMARAKSKRAWATQLAKREGISARELAQANDEANEAEVLAQVLREQNTNTNTNNDVM